MTRHARTTLPRFLPTLAAALALAVVTATPQAHAGPTISADLDLGTSIHHDIANPYGLGSLSPRASPLYVLGFRVRAGWRFDLGPVWLLPEIGGGYDIERYVSDAGTTQQTPHLPRVFGGGRVGLSLSLGPGLRFEPGLYGHAGFAQYQADYNGSAFDTGLSLDLRVLKFLIVGAQVGYDVVTVWHPWSDQPNPVGTGSGGIMMMPGGSTALADKWVSYGLHAGVLFW
jgi:hypothetical protein